METKQAWSQRGPVFHSVTLLLGDNIPTSSCSFQHGLRMYWFILIWEKFFNLYFDIYIILLFVLIRYGEGKCYFLGIYQVSNNVIARHKMYPIYCLQNLACPCYK